MSKAESQTIVLWRECHLSAAHGRLHPVFADLLFQRSGACGLVTWAKRGKERCSEGVSSCCCANGKFRKNVPECSVGKDLFG